MNPKPDLLPIITALRNDTGGGALIRRRVDPLSPVDVFIGIEPATGHLGVLLGIHRRLVPAARDLPGGTGFALRTHVIRDDVRDVINLGIFCTDAACEDIFLHLMEDIVSHLLAERSSEAALRAFLARVSLWQRFFILGRDSHLSEESQLGLFGELLVLRDLVIPAAGTAAGVEAWKGPEGSPQDFTVPNCALEVKCTRAKAGGRIPISNELQLDDRPFDFMVLVHVSVSQGGTDNPSLTDMVEGVRAEFAGPTLLTFNDKLITAGYLDAHVDRYRESRFFLRELDFYEVRDDFPRVRPGDFPVGVVEISYKIDVAAILPFKIEQPAVEARLRT
jgi:hypothetical protein